MESARLLRMSFFHQLLQILYKADDDHDGRTCEPKKKEERQDVHSDIDESTHYAILAS